MATPDQSPFRIVALVSGGGTTLQNLIDCQSTGRLACQLVGVVSSRADAGGVERARRAGLPVTIVAKKASGNTSNLPDLQLPATNDFAQRVWAAVREFKPDLVCFAGWLHLLPVPEDFRFKVLNIHPSLLPAFGGKGMYGLRVHEAVLAHGAKVTGCTVHFVDDSYDTGPILVQKCVPVLPGDNPATLAARVYQAECEAYPDAISLIEEKRIRIHGRRVEVVA